VAAAFGGRFVEDRSRLFGRCASHLAALDPPGAGKGMLGDQGGLITAAAGAGLRIAFMGIAVVRRGRRCPCRSFFHQGFSLGQAR